MMTNTVDWFLDIYAGVGVPIKTHKDDLDTNLEVANAETPREKLNKARTVFTTVFMTLVVFFQFLP